MEETNNKKKIDFRFELALFLILGFLLGVVIKTEASKRITIGYNDKDFPTSKQSYNFDKIQQELLKQGDASNQPVSENQESAEANK